MEFADPKITRTSPGGARVPFFILHSSTCCGVEMTSGQTDEEENKFSVVSIHCQTTAHSNALNRPILRHDDRVL